MVHDLVLKDAEQPAFFRGAALKGVLGLQGCQKGNLNDFFRRVLVPDPDQRIAVHHGAVIIQPHIAVKLLGCIHQQLRKMRGSGISLKPRFPL